MLVVPADADAISANCLDIAMDERAALVWKVLPEVGLGMFDPQLWRAWEGNYPVALGRLTYIVEDGKVSDVGLAKHSSCLVVGVNTFRLFAFNISRSPFSPRADFRLLHLCLFTLQLADMRLDFVLRGSKFPIEQSASRAVDSLAS